MGKSGIHLAEVSVFAGMTGKNRHLRDLSQQVLSEVVVSEKRGKCIRRQSVSTNFARDCWGFCNSFLKGVSK